MQLYRRPTPPQGFPTQKWQDTQQNAERLVEALLKQSKRKKPASASKKGKTRSGGQSKEAKTFPEIWKDYKPLFAYAQFEKCGFCECNVLATSPGDVEHYRPKSKISELRDDPKALGMQQEASASLTKRLVDPVSETGYYWLAYEWSNYLLSCRLCNGLKTTIFPVKKSPRRVPPLKVHPLEDGLLLNPFEKKQPVRHLKFMSDGFVRARSPYGRATIETCGLYREALITARANKASSAYQLAEDLRRNQKTTRIETLQDCYTLGADDVDHCGMVRAIIEEQAGISWEQLVKEYAGSVAFTLKQNPNRATRKMIENLEKMGRERFEHSAAVRQLVEKTCGINWGDVVIQQAQQLAADFMACKDDWKNDARYELKWKRKFYLLARDNPGQIKQVKEAYEKKSRLAWDDLKAEVEAGPDKLLWKLPADAD